MSKTQSQNLATIAIQFDRGDDVTFRFDVNDKITAPTSKDLQTIAFAKLVSQLVGALLSAEALPQINAMVEHVSVCRDLESE